ncbi:RNA polymerase sigma factor [Rhabdobacter roseus]|uniref:RNA polymerase sigma-70 factor (ECF subfamily) n=1 Tax=Rhabdobacter roseus TaxID=1655419 RepID=A0A840U2Y1_9BACT|nr:sigma-70 family RNA polymerase sigma factor [Rhabdobacter roseus]MBB5286480.1 RNA polymerase sigma-70 factor (ECF subfamily) [Rhabdobacter roseus]
MRETTAQDIDHKHFSSADEDLGYFDGLYEQYHQAVYANILKLVRQPELAEDLLQDVFLALWEHRSTLERERVANWLFVVSYNKSVSYLKKVRRAPSLTDPQAAELENVADGVELSEEEFMARLAMIEEAVAQLPERKKEIFRRYRFEGRSLEEIAQGLNLSVHTVKDHLKVANKSIREYIARKYPLSLTADLVLLLLYFSY